MSYQYSGPLGVWQYSLYSTNPNVHCGEIAQKYGGGGHRGAAGFSSKITPHELT